MVWTDPDTDRSLHRRRLLDIYAHALEAVGGRQCVKRTLERDAEQGPFHVIAIGKAAAAMMAGAADHLGEGLVAGLLITKEGHVDPAGFPPSVTLLEAGHPEPTAASLAAGEALVRFIEQTPAAARLLFLISGGSSALVERLPEGVDLETLRRVNRWLLGSGLDIHAMNHVRKALSTIKGGRLARHLGEREARVLLISDVPGDDPATIGSGLLVPEILLETEAPLQLPDWLEALMAKAPPAPAEGEPCYQGIDLEIIATLDDARRAAAQKGRELGYEVYEHAGLLGGDARRVGEQLATELLHGPAGLHIWGGETTVQLPAEPGRGGRNQHLALAAALQIEGCDDLLFLAAGTDGSDGPTEEGGALVDGATLLRGEDEGLDAAQCLALADSGSFLAASGDLIQTGPTGTNVMDLILGLKG